MKKQPVFIAVMFTVFMFPVVGNINNADAEQPDHGGVQGNHGGIQGNHGGMIGD